MVFSSASTTCCRRASCSGSRLTCRPAAPRRGRYRIPTGISANQTTVFDSETIRGRIGYAADNILFYATGGFAWSNDQFVRTQLTGTLNDATAGADEAVNKGLLGWTGGGGIAYAFAQNWNVFAEYRYTNFGTSTVPLPLSQLTTTTTMTVSAVRIRREL